MSFVNPNLTNLRNPCNDAENAGEQPNRFDPHLSHVAGWLPVAFETFNLRVFGNSFALFSCAKAMAKNSALEKLKNVMNDAGKSVVLFAEMMPMATGQLTAQNFTKESKN